MSLIPARSALAEAARGQVAGARTATEMAIIDAQMRTRLATREGHIHSALEDVAEKCFYLSKKYMKNEKLVRVSGYEGWREVTLSDIRDVDMNFKMVGYNPIRQNASVLAETMQKLMPLLMADPNIDKRVFIEELVAGVGLPARLLIPKEQLEAEAAAQAQAMAAAMGGAGGMPGLPPGLPPELAAQAGVPTEAAVATANEPLPQSEQAGPPPAEESLAGGGPSPVRT